MNMPDSWKRQLEKLPHPAQWSRPVQMAAASALLALLTAAAMWSGRPDYRVLFSNLDDRDGGAIISALSKMDVPYRLSDTGQAILIPADRVHETRLQLAQQGLPRSAEAGFELMDHPRFGTSQFAEQVNYQRALEGELASSIQTMHTVQAARVHLAIPRDTLFVRERQPPTASVLLTLYPGRTLSDAQVNAISWLVSSSVPRLNAANVSVVDQDGRLLSALAGDAGADISQRRLVHDIEQRTVQRILTLLNPLVGSGNVRAQATADIDFSHKEQTSEVYRPNETAGQAAVRSKQTSHSTQHNVADPQGVPGALSNMPPVNATAVIDSPADSAAAAVTSNTLASPADISRQSPANHASRHDATVNYEVDRTISHVKQAQGAVRRLSVAVVVNYRNGEDGPEPLADDDMAKLKELVRQAMGYSEERGDTLSVVNSPFADSAAQLPPFWRDPVYVDHAARLLRYLLLAIAAFLLWRAVGRRIVAEQSRAAQERQAQQAREQEDLEQARAAERLAGEVSRHEENLKTARDIASKDPRAVAMVLRAWMEKKNGKHG